MPPRLSIRAALCLALAACGCSRSSDSPVPPKPKPAVVAPAATAPAAEPRKATGGPRRFEADSGLSFAIPDGWSLQTRRSPSAPDTEVVLLYPDTADPQSLWEDPARLDRGAIVVELMPLTAAERGDAGFAERVLKGVSEAFPGAVTRRKLTDLSVPAARLDVSSPPHLRLVAFPKDHVFKLRARAWTPEVDALARSLKAPR